VGRFLPALVVIGAIETGSVDHLVTLITSESANGIRERFQKVTAAKKFSAEDVNAVRGYVKPYVEFVHYVEGFTNSSKGEATNTLRVPASVRNARKGAYHG
jgi:hypothetical protein